MLLSDGADQLHPHFRPFQALFIHSTFRRL